MKKLLLLGVTLVAVAGLQTVSSSAQASDFAIHVAGPGYHVDFGRAHRQHVYYGRGHGGYGGWPDRHHDHYDRGGHVWHDTSHYDYHPGGFVRHYDHYDYVPGHYDYHRTGHWDHYGW
jgi:hypothetical protein